MAFLSINPATAVQHAMYPAWDSAQIEAALAEAHTTAPVWRQTPIAERAAYLHAVAKVLRNKRESIASTITAEMGKLRREALAEVEKSVWVCEHYAIQAQSLLSDEVVKTDAERSVITCEALGTVLGIMPWNFHLWQVMRFAAPTLMAGNTVLLKHASNVPECALLVQAVFDEANVPRGVFRLLMLRSAQIEQVIADSRIHAVSLTGSESTGRRVAAIAGEHLKKCVLELGGSDPFVVLDDADLDLTVPPAVLSRFQNAGQSCIAAKRIIVADAIADEFVARLVAQAATLRTGDPADEATRLAPLARDDLRVELQRQVSASHHGGARILLGGTPQDGSGFFYPATVLDHVCPGTPAWNEELFGPVAAVIRVPNEAQALRVANDSRFGLGGSVWTRDAARGERLAHQLVCGAAFVNGVVKSDPRLPIGGVKSSGFGRELGRYGLLEFVNVKTLWMK